MGNTLPRAIDIDVGQVGLPASQLETAADEFAAELGGIAGAGGGRLGKYTVFLEGGAPVAGPAEKTISTDDN